MKSPRLRALALLLLALGGCTESPVGPRAAAGPPAGTSLIINDAANGGTPGFYFLPPMVPDPGPFTGTFDGTLTPVAKICVFNGATCVGNDVAVFAVGGGKQKLALGIVGESYNGVWQVPTTTTVGSTYRVRVYRDAAGANLAGYADLIIVAKSKDTKTVPAGYIGVVRGSSFNVKFRFETVGPSDVAPFVQSQTPDNNATDVAATANVVVNFAEAVSVTGAWFQIACGTSGTRGPAQAAVSGGPTIFTIDPNADFAATETCTVTVYGAQVTDQDGIDPPDAMATDKVWSFTVAAGPANVAPTAQADAFVVNAGATLTGNVFSDNGSAADALGAPAATLTSFGGGSLGGAVTDHPGGASVALAGGTLTVNANGSLTLASPTAVGVYTVQYRLTNAAGSSDATATITVNEAPVAPDAVNDGPSGSSTPGNPYHGAFNSLFSLSAPGLLANDALGTPAGAIASYGGGSLGGAVTDHAAASTATFGTGGSLTVNADGSVSFTPSTGFTGVFTFQYRLANGTGSDDATVAIAVGARPAATNDTYTPALVGNVPINTTTSTNFSVLTNDAGDGRQAVLVSAAGGTAAVNASGTFTFAPNAGFEGAASITYKVTNGFGDSPSNAVVSLTVGEPVWFVDAAAAVNGDGRFGTPFNCLTGAGCASDAARDQNDRLFLASGAYTGGIPLQFGERVIGQGATGNFGDAANADLTWPADAGTPPALGGTAPTITSASDGLVLGTSNTLRGITLGNAAGSALMGVSIGSLRISQVSINSTGQALNLSGGILDGSLTSVSSSGGVNNVLLNAVGTSAFSLGSGALSGSTGDAFRIQGGSSGLFAYTGSISGGGGAAVYVGGSSADVNLGGSVSQANAGSRGVFLENATGTMTFAGTLSLTTGTANAFEATNSSLAGTVVVQNVAGNTLTTTTGTALRVNNVNIGASGMTFTSISANGGANGIVLNNTGTAGGLTVTGTGTTGSGGTIVDMVGADGAVAGNGIYLNTTRKVSLAFMNLSGHQNNGLLGTSVRDLVMNRVRFTGTNGTSNSGTFNESAVRLTDASGGVKLTNSRFDGGAMNAVRVANSSGTLDSLVLAADTVESMQGSVVDVRGTALLVDLTGGNADVRIRNNRVTAWWGNAIHVLATGAASASARILNNTAHNMNGALAGAGGIWVTGGSLTYRIADNVVRNTDGTAISADRANFGSLMQGVIENNTIGVSGVANSGSNTGIGIFASHHGPGTTTVRIATNTLRQINGSANGAITAVAGDAAAFGGSGTMNATITGNNIQESGTTVNNAQHGILVTHGVQSGPPSDSDQGCYDVINNTILNFTSGTANNRIRVNQRFSTTSRWPGYVGAATGGTSETDLATYLLNRNTASTSTNANSSTGGFLNTNPAGSACPQPSAP